jgi:hypothetical protein
MRCYTSPAVIHKRLIYQGPRRLAAMGWVEDGVANLRRSMPTLLDKLIYDGLVIG